jgi:hypothetical protein
MDGRVDGFLGSAAGFQWWRQECESSLWFVRTRAGVCFFLPGLMWRQPALLVGLWGEGRGRQSRTMASLARPECWAGNVRRPRPPSSSFVRFRLDGSGRCAGLASTPPKQGALSRSPPRTGELDRSPSPPLDSPAIRCVGSQDKFLSSVPSKRFQQTRCFDGQRH